MSTSVSRLNFTFLDAEDNEVRFSFNYADSECADAAVKALMQGMITNGDIFSTPPVSMKAAAIVTTETTAIDLS